MNALASSLGAVKDTVVVGVDDLVPVLDAVLEDSTRKALFARRAAKEWEEEKVDPSQRRERAPPEVLPYSQRRRWRSAVSVKGVSVWQLAEELPVRVW